MSNDLAVHARHCNQGDYVGGCKYGEEDCPTLTAGTVLQRLQAGAYETKLPYPSRATEPNVLRKRVCDLTANELVMLQAVLEAYRTAEAEYNRDYKAYHADQARLCEQFRADLEAEFGVADHPDRDRLWDMAVAKRNPFGGYLEIYQEFVRQVTRFQ